MSEVVWCPLCHLWLPSRYYYMIVHAPLCEAVTAICDAVSRHK